MCGSFDGPRHKLGEKTHESRKSNKIICRGDFFPIDIYSVTQGLEGIKTNSYRKYDLQCVCLNLIAQKSKSTAEVFDEKIVILEKAQESDVGKDA